MQLMKVQRPLVHLQRREASNLLHVRVENLLGRGGGDGGGGDARTVGMKLPNGNQISDLSR